MTFREWLFFPVVRSIERAALSLGVHMSKVQDQIDAAVGEMAVKTDALESKVTDAVFELREIKGLLDAAQGGGTVDLTALVHIGERLDSLAGTLGAAEVETDPTPDTAPGGQPL